MKSWINLNNRKKLYIILSLVVIFVFTLTIVYAALVTTLKIVGNAEVTASSWDIYLDNVKLHSGSVTSNVPIISDKTTVSFTTTLTNPGDYYMFTVDVVNNGSIDAMIDSITKSPTLSSEQSKYLNYIVEYERGESISTKQLAEANSFVRLKVKVEYRKDLVSTDLPNNSETLNLSFKVNYVQSDDSNTNVNINNNGKLIKIVSGDLNTVGSEICFKDECFYLIENDGINVTMLSKYNLYVGGSYDRNSDVWTPYGDEATGIQSSSMLAYVINHSNWNGITKFSDDVNKGVEFNEYSGSLIEKYINNYKIYLKSLELLVKEVRLISMAELRNLGCGNGLCVNAPKWVYSTSYWTNNKSGTDRIFTVDNDGEMYSYLYNNNQFFGVRPVIEISLDNFN